METAEMILLKGKPKTQEIASYRQDAKGVWWVEFNGGNLFPYKNRDLKVLSSPVEIAPNSYRITNKAGACFNPKRIWVYTHSLEKYYRVEFEDNVIHEYSANYLNVEESILADKDVLNLFNYLKEVSAVNIIETENGPISLHDQYDKIDFVNENCAMAPFLKPSLLKKYDGYDSYLFPFHSNRSQIEAVKRVFSSQISVIQGPPGTGKTQTILNVIANIVVRGMTVLVVSNNNSAVENVFEKLRKEGLGFIVAPLGKSENKARFITNGQSEYPDMSDWEIECPKEISRHVGEITKELDEIFRKQEQQAKDRLELSSLETEKKYFLNDYDSFNLTNRCKMTSDSLMHMWLQIEDAYEKEYIFTKVSFIKKIIRRFRRFFLVRRVKRMLNVKGKSTLQELLIEIKTLYYITHKSELKLEIEEIDTYLKDKKAEDFSKRQVELSMAVFRHFLKHKYKGGVRKRQVFGTEDLYKRSEDVAKEYPVVLSTTFSSRGNLPNHIFDYLIMDEASQVPIDSAALALSVAKNAVIVGDTQQLPNIVENDVKPQLAEINKKYNIYEYYNCLEQSFLSSVVGILPKVPQTLLREHYRCSPMIINYCNQKFYGGNLIIMTKPRSDEQIMKVIKTVRGPLAKSLYNTKEDKWDMFNQREVDEFQCLLDNVEVDGTFDIGVITPYRGQVKLFHKNIRHKDIEIDTIHKFQVYVVK
ncbi:AAA domain-containing protein [Hoylesella oralis]|uniref:AAA domain-containing protein n=1 Tax=Hoylesella oralis TaxID=28134 RepID=UPI0028E3329A|nr:AAA domain-containing protein [Hoylesella oralis]